MGKISLRLVRVWRYLKRYWYWEIFALVFTVVATLATIRYGWLIKNLIDDVLIPRNFPALLPLCLLFAGLVIISVVAKLLKEYLFALAGQSIIVDIRGQLFNHILSLPQSIFSKTKTGEIMSRILSDVDNVQQMVTYAFVEFVTSLVTVVGILTWLFIVNWQLALVALPVVPVFILISQKMSNRVNAASRMVQEKTADITGIIQEAISGIEIVKSFSMENIISKTFFKKLKDLFHLRVRRSLQSTFMNFSWEAILLPYQAVLFGIGGYWYITRGTPSIGTLFAFLNYVNILVGPALTLVSIIAQISQAFASFDRIFEYFSYQSEKSGNKILSTTIRGAVTYDNVSFSYNDTTPVLKNVSLNINPGERVALVGPTGSGKTTLIRLLLRLYDPQEGRITIDGIPIEDVTLESLRSQIGVVPQETFLFNTTIKENLLYVKPRASMEEIIDACQKARVDEFITSLPEGYQTVVGEKGIKLSGGEKQRISIARAILKNPKILVMDEPTASLDALTESALWKAANEYFQGKTMIIIAHRFSTVQTADKIIVLNRGEIVEQGIHQQLLEMKGLYARLYHKQFKS